MAWNFNCMSCYKSCAVWQASVLSGSGEMPPKEEDDGEPEWERVDDPGGLLACTHPYMHLRCKKPVCMGARRRGSGSLLRCSFSLEWGLFFAGSDASEPPVFVLNDSDEAGAGAHGNDGTEGSESLDSFIVRDELDEAAVASGCGVPYFAMSASLQQHVPIAWPCRPSAQLAPLPLSTFLHPRCQATHSAAGTQVIYSLSACHCAACFPTAKPHRDTYLDNTKTCFQHIHQAPWMRHNREGKLTSPLAGVELPFVHADLEESFHQYLDYLLFSLADPDYPAKVATDARQQRLYMRAVRRVEEGELAHWRCGPASASCSCCR